MIENGINQNQKIVNRIEIGTLLYTDFHFYYFSSRSNSGANGSSTTSISHMSSPKNPLHHQSPGVSLSSKTPISSSSTGLSASVPPHFTYPISTQPVLQYSTIVSQNTPSSSTTTSNSNSKSSNILSPQPKSMSRQTSVNNHESNTLPTTTSTNNSTATNSHSSTLLTNNDRTGILNFISRIFLANIEEEEKR